MKFSDKVFFGVFSIALIAIIVIAGNYQISNSTNKLPNPNVEWSNLINGQPLPNTPGKAMAETRVITQPVTDARGKSTGWVIISSRASRDVGTRAPVHVHPYGGQTCVLSGEMSLYLDGEPTIMKAGPNECYWMPANRRMSAINTGSTASTFIDTFVVPAGEQVWLVVEPGLEDSQDQFDMLFNTKEHVH